MKKQTTRAKAPVKTKAKSVKTTRSSKAVVAKKKVTKRKGLVHHTKRIYHFTPKFVHGALMGAFVGMLMVTWIGSTGNAHADQPASNCTIEVTQPDRGTQMVDPVDGPKKFHKEGDRAYVKVALVGDKCTGTQKVTLAAWKAPAADFKPYKDQVLAAYNNRTLLAGDTVTMSIGIPKCYFQIDLVRGSDPKGKNDGGAYEEGRMIHSIKGGNNPCEPPEQPVTQKVCNVATGKIVTIPAGTYNTAKYAPVNDPRCQARPGYVHVCELSTGNIVEVPVGAYNTTQYGPLNAKECNSSVILTTPSSTLTKTGPPALLTTLAFAVVGGYTFHHAHRHVKSRKQRKHA